jgi:hypothetical protein
MKDQVSGDMRGRMAESCADKAAWRESARVSRGGKTGARSDALISSDGGHWERLNPTRGGEWRSISDHRQCAEGARKWMRIQSSAEQSVAQRAWEGSRSQPCQRASRVLAGGPGGADRRARRVCREGWEGPPEGADPRGLFPDSRRGLLSVSPYGCNVRAFAALVAGRAEAQRRGLLLKGGEAPGSTQVIMSSLYKGGG